MSLLSAGRSHVGLVREDNEDTLLLEPSLGLYAVFDGMGGAKAGDVASQLARDEVHRVVRARLRELPPRELLEQALQAACAAVHRHSKADRELRGMGTTAVVCLVGAGDRALVAHVGDSRAYLWRDGRLTVLTLDHTLVAELIGRGVLTAEEAEVHPHRSVLSRNLGAAEACRVDFIDVALVPGDRILLCSDGLTGFAPPDAIGHQLSSGDSADDMAQGLVELALRGGGGDNVTAVIIEAVNSSLGATESLRRNCAMAWWHRREVFAAAIDRGGLAFSPVLVSLGEASARELLREHVCQAVFHDLERSTAVNMWTFSHGLAQGWLRTPGDDADRRWPPLRSLFDGIAACAAEVVENLRTADQQLAAMVEASVGRIMCVADLAAATVLADQLRELDDELVAYQARLTVDGDAEFYGDQATIPFVRTTRAITTDAGGPELRGAVHGVIRLALGELDPEDNPLLVSAVQSLESVALADDLAAVAAVTARELFGVRSVDDEGMAPLLALGEQLRRAIADGFEQIEVAAGVRAATFRRLALAQQRLTGALAQLMIEAAEPASLRLRELAEEGQSMRARLALGDRQLAKLERAFATVVDHEPVGGRDWKGYE